MNAPVLDVEFWNRPTDEVAADLEADGLDHDSAVVSVEAVKSAMGKLGFDVVDPPHPNSHWKRWQPGDPI